MAAEAPGPPPAGPARAAASDGLWLLVIWIVLSIIGCLLVALVLGPAHAPGRGLEHGGEPADRHHGARHDRHPGRHRRAAVLRLGARLLAAEAGDETDAVPLHGNIKVQATWIVATSAIVLAPRGLRHGRADRPGGRGRGPGPAADLQNGMPPRRRHLVAPNTNNILQVQVIGQQWAWTYRYPQFGGFETTELVLPVNQPVQFNVTSLDVIHSFWAYTLGVKADANPGVNNVAYTTPNTTGHSRCAAPSCAASGTARCTTRRGHADSDFMAWTKATEMKLAERDQDPAAVRADLRPDRASARARSTRNSA